MILEAGGAFGGGLTVSGGTSTITGAVTTTNSAVDLQQALVLDGDASFSTGTGAIDFATIDDDNSGATPSALSITSNAAVTLNGAIGGTFPIDSITVNDAGAGTATLSIGGGAITASGGTMVFNTPVTLTADTTLVDTGATGITFGAAATVNSDGTARALSLNSSGGGSIAFNAAIGNVDPLASLTIVDSSGTTLAQAASVDGAVQLTDTTGTINFQGVLTAGSVTANATPFVVDFDVAPDVSGAGSFSNTDGTAGTADLIFDAGGAFDGGLTVNGAGTISEGTETDLAGTLTTQGGNASLTLDETLTLIGSAALETGNGTLLTNAITDEGNDFTLSIQNVTSTGAATIRGDLDVGTLTTFGAGYTLNLLENVSITNDTNFLNTGSLVLGDGADDVQLYAGGLATTGNATNPGTTSISGAVSTTATDIDLGLVTLGANSTIDAANGTLDIQSITDGGGFDLVLDGGTGAIAVTSAVDNLGGLEVRDSGSTTFGGTVEAGAVTLTDTTGLIDFQNVLTATSVTAAAEAFAIDFDAAPNVSGLGNFDNTGGITFDAGGFFGGGLDVAASTTTAAGAFTTTNDAITLQALTLTADTSFDSAGGNVAIGDVTSAGFALTLDALDTGTINLASLAGDGDLTVIDSAGATFAGGVAASTVTLTDTTGTISFNGDTTISTQLATASQPYNLAFTGANNTVAGDTTLANTGTVTIDSTSTQFTGGFDSRSAAGGTSLAGTLLTTGAGQLDLGATTLTDTATLNSGTGAINVASVAGAAQTLNLQSAGGSGDVSILGDVTVAALTTGAQAYGVSLLGGGTITNAVSFTNTGNTALGDTSGDALTFNGGVTATAGTVSTGGTIQTSNDSITLGVGAAATPAAGTVTLDANTTLLSGSGGIQLANVTDGANNFTLQVQDNTSTGAVTINGALTVNALVTGTAAFGLSLLDGATLAADMDFTNGGALVLGDSSSDVFDFNGGLDTRNGPSSLNLAGTIRTDSRAMDLIDATLGANTTLASGSAAISTGAITDGASASTLSLQEDTAALRARFRSMARWTSTISSPSVRPTRSS